MKKFLHWIRPIFRSAWSAQATPEDAYEARLLGWLILLVGFVVAVVALMGVL